MIHTERAASLHQRARFGVDEGAATGAEHDALVLEQAGDHLDLASAEIGLAMGGEDLLDGHAGGLFHLLVAIDETAAELGGKAAADGGLAGAHHADEHDRAAANEAQQFFAAVRMRKSCRRVTCASPVRPGLTVRAA